MASRLCRRLPADSQENVGSSVGGRDDGGRLAGIRPQSLLQALHLGRLLGRGRRGKGLHMSCLLQSGSQDLPCRLGRLWEPVPKLPPAVVCSPFPPLCLTSLFPNPFFPENLNSSLHLAEEGSSPPSLRPPHPTHLKSEGFSLPRQFSNLSNSLQKQLILSMFQPKPFPRAAFLLRRN